MDNFKKVKLTLDWSDVILCRDQILRQPGPDFQVLKRATTQLICSRCSLYIHKFCFRLPLKLLNIFEEFVKNLQFHLVHPHHSQFSVIQIFCQIKSITKISI